MRTGDNIKMYRKEIGLTQKELADKVNLSSQVISNIERNYSSVSAEDLANIAKVLSVTPNQLLGESDSKGKKYYELTEKEKGDIAIQAEKLIEGIENGDNINYYGEPATQSQKDRLLTAIRTAMEMNKEEAKKKFTRKDYRDWVVGWLCETL